MYSTYGIYTHLSLYIINRIPKARSINHRQPQLDSSLPDIHGERINVHHLHDAVYSQESINTSCKPHQTQIASQQVVYIYVHEYIRHQSN